MLGIRAAARSGALWPVGSLITHPRNASPLNRSAAVFGHELDGSETPFSGQEGEVL
jgi:hypothetical protein